MGSIYVLFSDFHDIKTYIYNVLKFICSTKEQWWSLTLSWPDKVQRIFSTAYEFYQSETKSQMTTCLLNYANVMILTLLYLSNV